MLPSIVNFARSRVCLLSSVESLSRSRIFQRLFLSGVCVWCWHVCVAVVKIIFTYLLTCLLTFCDVDSCRVTAVLRDLRSILFYHFQSDEPGADHCPPC